MLDTNSIFDFYSTFPLLFNLIMAVGFYHTTNWCCRLHRYIIVDKERSGATPGTNPSESRHTSLVTSLVTRPSKDRSPVYRRVFLVTCLRRCLSCQSYQFDGDGTLPWGLLETGDLMETIITNRTSLVPHHYLYFLLLFMGTVMHRSCCRLVQTPSRPNITDLAKQWILNIGSSGSYPDNPVIFVILRDFIKGFKAPVVKNTFAAKWCALLSADTDPETCRVQRACFFKLQASGTKPQTLGLGMDANISKLIPRALAFETKTFDSREGAGECSWSPHIYW